LQANIWYRQHRLEEAKLEALRALGFYEKLRAVRDVENCRGLLQVVEKAMKS
jgi:hypothetical protein